jgi:hypothetical protein
MKHSTITVPTITPNMLMVQFLNAVRRQDREGGHLASFTGLDPAETDIAVAVGVRQGWLTADCHLTPAGLAVIRKDTVPIPDIDRATSTRTISFADLYRDRDGLSKSLYVQIKAVLPPHMLAALEEIHVANCGFEDFETRHDLPSRSAKVVVRLALEAYALNLATIL